MLKTASLKPVRLVGGRFAVVASAYNRRYVDGMLRAAREVLAGAADSQVEVHRVPGSFEIPVAAAALARRAKDRPEAILCLGVIWQGATTHAQHIGEAVSQALMQIAIETGVPVIHEVLTVATKEQAEQRCLAPETNRGKEAAQTALAMAVLMRRIGTSR